MTKQTTTLTVATNNNASANTIVAAARDAKFDGQHNPGRADTKPSMGYTRLVMSGGGTLNANNTSGMVDFGTRNVGGNSPPTIP